MQEEQVVTPTEEQAEVVEEVVSEVVQGVSPEPDNQVETEEQPPQKKGRDAESRIHELTWKAKSAQEQAEYWREQYERSRQPQQEAQPVAEEPQLDLPPAPVPPDRFDFDSDDEYRKALGGFQQENAKYMHAIIQKNQEAAIAKQREQQRATVMNERQRTLAQKIDAGRVKYHDFDMVINNPSVPISQTMTESLVDAENSADIAYHLGTNIEEARRIASLAPIQQVMEIAKLDLSLGKKPKTTNAPPPSEPVRAATSDGVIDVDKLSTDEWLKLRNAGKI